MKPPWSTAIIDELPIDWHSKLVLKTWIWTDRLLWSGVSIAATCLVAALLK